MRIFKVAAMAGMFVAAGWSGAAHAATVTAQVNGSPAELGVPQGWCTLTQADVAAAGMSALFPGDGVLAYMTPCNELQNGKIVHMPTVWGSWSERDIQIAGGMTRENFLKAASKIRSYGDYNAGQDGPKADADLQLKKITQDNMAIYMGGTVIFRPHTTLGDVTGAAQTDKGDFEASVMVAMTPLNGQGVGFTLYKRKENNLDLFFVAQSTLAGMSGW